MSDTQRNLTIYELTSSGSIVAESHQFVGMARCTAIALRHRGSGLIREGDVIKADGPDVLAEKAGAFVMPPTGEARVLPSKKPPLRVNGKGVATTSSRVQTDCQIQPVCAGGEIFQRRGELIRINSRSVVLAGRPLAGN